MQTGISLKTFAKVAALFACGLALSVGLAGQGGAAQAGAPASLPAAKAMSKIEQRVLQDTANGRTASFVVVLAEQANLTSAYTMRDQDARGWYVYNTLREVAQKSQASLRTMLDSRGAQYQSLWAVNGLIVTGNRALVEAIAARSDVRIIESNRPGRWIEEPEVANTGVTDGPQVPNVPEWGVQRVNAPQVWALGYTGQGIVIGNQDTGVRWTHNALKPKYRGWDGTNANHNYNWWDAIHTGGGSCGANTQVPCDDSGHGTHTTGTTVGDDGAGNQVGVAPGAKWIGCRNMDQGVGTPATYTECFQFFIAPTDLTGQNPNPALRPHVMNNSWGCPPSEGCSANTLQQIVENTQAAGIFVEVSAGNAGNACSTVNDPPAIYAASFSTGAIDINNNLAGFSSRGPVTVDGSNRRKPDISAPGVNVRSSTRTSDSSYGNLSGTSMAGPHVVGVVALLWSAQPSLTRMITETKTILENTANPQVNVTSGPTTCGGIPYTQIPNNHFGYGRVDALAAVNSVGGTPTVTPAATNTPPAATNTPPVASPTPCAVGAWTFGPAYSPAVYAVQGATASDGFFYIAGGQDDSNIPMNNANRYNPATNTWSALAPLPVAVGQAALGTSGTKVYVAGGYIGGSSITSTLQIYDIPTNSWTFGPPMPAAKEASAGVVLGNRFYVIGGDDFNATVSSVYAYDIATNTWSTFASLPEGRTNVNGTASGGFVYTFGGVIGASFNADDSLLRYDPAANTWTPLADAGLTDLGNYADISAYGAGRFLATVGGSTSFDPSNRTRIYDIATNTWSEGPAMNEARLGHAQDTLPDGRIIAVTGYDGSGVLTSTELLSAGVCPTVTVAPTSTRTPTAVAPTATNTSGPIPSATSTNTAVVPTGTPGGPTDTPVAPSATSVAATPTTCPIQFSDVEPGTTWYDYVRCLACRGIISGYNDQTFRPNNDITRGQIAKIVSQSAGFQEPPGPQIYEDVPTGSPFYDWINRLTNRGLIGGYPCGQTPNEPCIPPDNRPYYRPNTNATRGQLAKIVATAAYINDPVTGQFYQDVPPSHSFYVWIEQLSNRGVMGGYPCGNPEPCVPPDNKPYFRPFNSVTRGQASKIVANTFFPNCQTP